MENTTTAGAVEQLAVTQSDRDAAAPFANCLSDMQDIFDGKADGLPVVQAFARHRISHSLPGDVGMRQALATIKAEADIANEVIRLRRDQEGSGRVKVATALHRIAETAAALTPSALSGDAGEKWSSIADELRACDGWGGLKIGKPENVVISSDLRERILAALPSHQGAGEP